MKIERRHLEIRADADKRSVSGAIRFNVENELLSGYRELVLPGAYEFRSDMALNLEHEPARLLAKHPKSLRLDQRSDGLYFDADIVKTRDGDDALELVRQEVVSGASVEMVVKRQSFRGNVRVIEKAALHGLALTSSPAHSSIVQADLRSIWALSRPIHREASSWAY